MGAEISFKRPDGREAKGYLSNAAKGDAPGLVVIQEWWGLQEQIKAMCDRFALAGFDALAPDLYNGVVVPYHDSEAAGKEMSSLNFIDATDETVRGAVQFLMRNGAKVGLTGFCMGGAVAVIGAARIPELSAAVSFYGIPPEAGRPAGGREGSAAGPFRRQGRLRHPRDRRRLRTGTEGGWEGLRVLPLRRRSRLRQRTARGRP